MLMLGAFIAASILLSRWLSVFALGDELYLLGELCLGSLLLGLTVIALFAGNPPSHRASHRASSSWQQTTPCSPEVLTLGRWAGILAVQGLYALAWCAIAVFSHWLFYQQEPGLLTFANAAPLADHLHALLVPTLLVLLLGAFIASLCVVFATRFGLGGSAASVLVVLVVLTMLAGSHWSLTWLMPDLRLTTPQATLYAIIMDAQVLGGIALQLLGGLGLSVLIGGVLLRTQSTR